MRTMKALFLAIVTSASIAASAALAETDDFAGTGALGAGWETLIGTAPARSSDELVYADNFSNSVIRRTGAAYPNDQEATVDYKHPADTGDQSEGGPCVRVGDTGETGYCVSVYAPGTNFAQIKKLTTAGEWVDLDSGGGPCAATQTADAYDTWRIVVSGTSLTLHKDGVQLTGCNGTDDDVASGKPGLHVDIADIFPTMDNFSGTDAAGGGGASPLKAIINTPIRGGGLLSLLKYAVPQVTRQPDGRIRIARRKPQVSRPW